MKKQIYILIILVILFPKTAITQELPYPIVFIHGLNSSDETWKNTITQLNELYGLRYSTNNIFYACLNAYKDMTRLEGQDGILGTIDDDVLMLAPKLTKRDIYVVNFDTYWNENPKVPQIYYNTVTYDVSSGESKSNQSSIIKQGYALSIFIREIINQTGVKKVILVGHSMGGLCAREYLQRRENGKPKWWYDPNSADGHRVAKLVTIGTPHFGCNSGSFSIIDDKEKNEDNLLGLLPNTSSEAVRDLRYSYLAGDGGAGRYLFGGLESGLTSLPSGLNGWHNRDVNCNGTITDNILGINTELENSMPLPRNIAYHWITSDISLTNGDEVVDLDRQWIYTTDKRPYPNGITDTTLTHKYHWNEPDDYFALLRGLDEPPSLGLSYNLEIGKTYIGFRNYIMNYNKHDTDTYRIDISKLNLKNGQLTLKYLDLIADGFYLKPCKLILYDVNGYYVMDTTFTNIHIQNTLIVNETKLTKFKGLIYLDVIGEAFDQEVNIPYNLSFTYKNITGLDDNPINETIDFSIFPNPIPDKACITLPKTELQITAISINNSKGIEVKRFEEKELSGQSSISFSTEEFSSGVYFCTINFGMNKITKSFVVIK